MSRLLHLLTVLGCVLVFGATTSIAQQSGGLARLQSASMEDARFGRTVIMLDLSQGVPWRLFTLDEPRRLVLDFREVDWSGMNGEEVNSSDRISALRVGRFQPGWSRMVLELAEPMAVEQAELKTQPETGLAQLAVTLRRSDDESFAKTAGAPVSPGWQAIRPEAQVAAQAGQDGPLRVMLDPGHGGLDPGAERTGINEADLMLQFAFELREALLRTGRYEVFLTREADVFVSLEARVAMAQQANADLFVSLHADAIAAGVAHGATVYVLDEEASDEASAALAERHDRDNLLGGVDLSGADDQVAQVLMEIARLDNTPRSAALARHLVNGIRNALGHVHKRPLRKAGFSVLKAADIPSVLVELGFLSTQQDLKNLQDPAWRAGMAAGIRDGIEAWAIEDEALSRLRRQ